MSYFAPISVSDILAGLTTDTTKWAGANIDARLNQIDIWSEPMTTVLTVDTTAGDETLCTVSIPNIGTGKTIRSAYALVRILAMTNSAGASGLINSDQYIQVNDSGATGWRNAIRLDEYDGRLDAGAWRDNVLWIGSIDIEDRCNFNDTVTFKWASADYSQNSLLCYGVRCGVRLII